MATPNFNQQNQQVNNQIIAGRDIHNHNNTDVNAEPPPGIGRFIARLGIFIFFVGFGIFGFLVVGFITQIFTGFGQFETPDMSRFSLLPLAFGLIFGGIVISIVGRTISNSQRNKHRQIGSRQ